uniref:8.9 kDa family member n=1 Tax=Rhipicephalus appendiculatus TaxID=34631 RepID=A0A131YU85_RHIAP
MTKASTMWTNGVVVIYLLCLSLTTAMIFFNNVQVIPINDVFTFGDYCYFDGQNFTGRMRLPDKCERWTCYANISVVVVVRCAELPKNCDTIGYRGDPLPKCCNTVCYPSKFMCQTGDNRMLMDGQELNSTKPCVRYVCKHGTLITQTCQGYGDSKCSAANIDPCAPYPNCCGAAKVCQG